MDYTKLHNRIDHLINYESDDFFLNINLNKDISDKLYDYQHLHLFNLITSFASRGNNCVVDGSDTGTGKTYTTIALCKHLNIRPFIVCPYTVMSNWREVCELFDVIPLGIVNYECIKTGKYYTKNGTKIKCKFIEVKQNDNDDDIKLTFKWSLPKYSILIFDEVHKCKNPKSQNGQLLMSAKKHRKVLMLSATLSDTPQAFHIFGYMLGFYNTLTQGKNWINGMLREDKSYIGTNIKLSAINKAIYPVKGSRMQISELGNKFPINQIAAQSYDVDDDVRNKVNKAFKFIDIETQSHFVSNLDDNSNGQILSEIMEARQILEEYKVDMIYNLANDYMENGFNVAIFLNFTKNINKIATLCKTNSVITGQQSIEKRMEIIDDFQTNKTNIIICSIQLIDGINLHDIHGKPRVSIISPSCSMKELVQTLGRICRIGSKTPALQRIVFCANTCEEIICNRIKEKLQFLSKLNDNNLVKIE